MSPCSFPAPESTHLCRTFEWVGVAFQNFGYEMHSYSRANLKKLEKKTKNSYL